MANPSKQKGTGGETELLNLLQGALPGLHRTPAGCRWDLETPTTGAPPINALASRPDHGRWLVTVDLPTFLEMLPLGNRAPHVRIESKRISRSVLHTWFWSKFGDK